MTVEKTNKAKSNTQRYEELRVEQEVDMEKAVYDWAMSGECPPEMTVSGIRKLQYAMKNASSDFAWRFFDLGTECKDDD